MKVGDLVKYKGWKAIITEIVTRGSSGRESYLYTLHFIGEAPSFLRKANNGFYPGFQIWELELLSTGEVK